MNSPAPSYVSAEPPPLADFSGSRKIRTLGWVLAVIGPCLSVTMAVIAANLFDTIHHLGRPAGSSRWHGGPVFTRTTFELFGAVFLLGIAIFAGGIYQIRTGRRHPVLIGMVLLLAAATAYLVCGILSAQSASF